MTGIVGIRNPLMVVWSTFGGGWGNLGLLRVLSVRSLGKGLFVWLAIGSHSNSLPVRAATTTTTDDSCDNWDSCNMSAVFAFRSRCRYAERSREQNIWRFRTGKAKEMLIRFTVLGFQRLYTDKPPVTNSLKFQRWDQIQSYSLTNQDKFPWQEHSWRLLVVFGAS